tara:strand:+ start:393 stop:1082 length:690 start_codon:yes stop_codon:yes gene_type:complete
MKEINVYIGYDSRQDRPPKYNKVINPCYQVCKSSIIKNSNDVNVIPLKLNELIDEGIYYREVDPLASTEFTYSRFLVPYLNDFKGIAIFCDSDFLWQCDINDLLEYYNHNNSVMCVQHDYTPKTDTKMDGVVQTTYPRKNWSSLMMFNCEHKDIKNLSVENINTKEAKYLHRMKWTDKIGEIPMTYNWLEGDYPNNMHPKVIHFTNGGPWHETWDGDYKENWLKVYNEL